MKRFLLFLCVLGLVIGLAGPAAAFYMNFEEGFGNDGGNIVGVPGVTFTDSGGLSWVYGDSNSGNWNTYSIDLNMGWGTQNYHHYGYVFGFLGVTGDWGRIDFDDQNGTWFQVGYCSNSTFYLEAYDASDNLIDTAVGAANLRSFGYLRVDAPTGTNIAYVKVHDAGNYWLVDELTGDMEGGFEPVPEPGTMLLVGSGLVGLAGLGRRKFFKK
jgi:hypothetical protein